MNSVLSVDDVQDYCDELAFGFARQNYNVKTATDPETAIAIGSVFRPDILITDWMLNDPLSGLDVASTLRLVRPDLQTILITAFASTDLHDDAKIFDVVQFIEKPFPIQEITGAVRRAVENASRRVSASPPFGIVEVDTNGRLSFMNSFAKTLFNPLSDAQTLQELFDHDTITTLENATDEWHQIFPYQDESKSWHVRGRKLPESGTLYVFLNDYQYGYKYDRLVSRLLGVPEAPLPNTQLNGHILVVDDADTVRRVTVRFLREFSKVCHGAHDHEEAIRIFANDPEIKTVIMDYQMGLADTAMLIQQLRTIRANVEIIGTSASHRAADFAKLGVHRFLSKPWQLEDFLKLVEFDTALE